MKNIHHFQTYIKYILVQYHMLGHNTNKFKSIEVIQSMLSDHDTLKLEIKKKIYIYMRDSQILKN